MAFKDKEEILAHAKKKSDEKIKESQHKLDLRTNEIIGDFSLSNSDKMDILRDITRDRLNEIIEINLERQDDEKKLKTIAQEELDEILSLTKSSEIDLSHLDVTDVSFEKQPKLIGANFKGAKIGGIINAISFENCNLSEANLDSCLSIGINYNKAILRKTRLKGQFDESTFVDADLSNADLSGSSFDNVDFTNSNLSFANLSGTQLIEANLAYTTTKGIVIDDKTVVQGATIGGHGWDYDSLLTWKKKGAIIERKLLPDEIARKISGLKEFEGSIKITFDISGQKIYLIELLISQLTFLGSTLNRHGILCVYSPPSSVDSFLPCFIKIFKADHLKIVYDTLTPFLEDFKRLYQFDCFEKIEEMELEIKDEKIALHKNDPSLDESIQNFFSSNIKNPEIYSKVSKIIGNAIYIDLKRNLKNYDLKSQMIEKKMADFDEGRLTLEDVKMLEDRFDRIDKER